MKKKIAALIAALAAVLILAGCEEETQKVNEQKKEKCVSRFVLVEKTGEWEIVYDHETNVMYAVSSGSYTHGNFTVLVDQNGDPLLYDDAQE